VHESAGWPTLEREGGPAATKRLQPRCRGAAPVKRTSHRTCALAVGEVL